MTVNEHLNEEEQAAVNAIRDGLGKRLPADLDTDLNLLRWIKGYQGDVDKIVQVIPEYVASRKAAGFDGGEKHIARYFDLPSIQPFLTFIASSQLGDTAWSESRNAFLFVEKAWSQPKEFVQVMKTSDYLLHCFGYSEYLLQLILRKERQIGRPVCVFTIFDLGELHTGDYWNPLAHHLKLWKLRSDLWQDWYPEIVQKIILVNPPRLINAFWGLTKIFLNERNRSLLHLAHSHKALEGHMESEMIPVAYGGKFKCALSNTDDTCCNKRKKITSKDHYKCGEHFEKYNVQSKPDVCHADISPGSILQVDVAVSDGQSAILWDFHTNGEVVFSVGKLPTDKDSKQQTNTLLYPKLKLFTGKVGEEGVVDGLSPGLYCIVFQNTSHFFHSKIDYSFCAA